MPRRFVLAGLLAVGVTAMLIVWLASNIERVPVQRHEPPRTEARRNPYLALERFVIRMGGTVTRHPETRVLDRLPEGGIVFLDRRRLDHLQEERLQRLLGWVEGGGYLIVVAEETGIADPLLDSMGVSRVEPASTEHGSGDRSISLSLPGAERALRVDVARQVLTVGERQPDWLAGEDRRGAQVVNFRLGRGNLTVACELDQQLSNRRIGRHDHAEMFWTLLRFHGHSSPPQVLLLSGFEMPTLAGWLIDQAWAACFATLVLIALWLWRIVPRFGPLRSDPPPVRRELREHLAAVGHYLWRCRAPSALLEPAREHFRHCLAQRRPEVAACSVRAQVSALAALSRLSPAWIALALAGEADDRQAFVEVLRTLQVLERHLRDDHDESRRRCPD
ncbi:DUF4350 domain-containing protein [Accumulibacter sp.]|uniref:DUF4350 domain-containing protein n=1 Tax=Accumulibacter sp. TaxID=2053492 RepID=UPI0025EFC883|nr:DUF4350 domain-containing protein [Accumulibacter sp.]MCM8625177.1 DUF4350 domain-containing protein [Accumulibacter sp.]